MKSLSTAFGQLLGTHQIRSRLIVGIAALVLALVQQLVAELQFDGVVFPLAPLHQRYDLLVDRLRFGGGGIRIKRRQGEDRVQRVDDVAVGKAEPLQELAWR